MRRNRLHRRRPLSRIRPGSRARTRARLQRPREQLSATAEFGKPRSLIVVFHSIRSGQRFCSRSFSPAEVRRHMMTDYLPDALAVGAPGLKGALLDDAAAIQTSRGLSRRPVKTGRANCANPRRLSRTLRLSCMAEPQNGCVRNWNLGATLEARQDGKFRPPLDASYDGDQPNDDLCVAFRSFPCRASRRGFANATNIGS